MPWLGSCLGAIRHLAYLKRRLSVACSRRGAFELCGTSMVVGLLPRGYLTYPFIIFKRWVRVEVEF